MRDMETRMTQKGQVTIPREIRSRLGLKPKDSVRFEIEGDIVTLMPARSKLLEGYGAVKPKSHPEDWPKVRAETEEVIARETAAEGR